MTDTLILGAGPAGLAMGACLRRRGVPFEILERADTVGSAWRGHYDRLKLHTARNHSGLPFHPFPPEEPLYVPRARVVAYLEDYARAFDLAPRFGQEVVRARRDGDGFEVRTRAGETFRARRVVVGTGYNRSPVVPRWPGDDRFRGQILHSSAYKTGAAFRGKRVLVVGIGNTGGEIAIDLHEQGAAEVAISVRSPVVAVPRDFLGVPTQITGILISRLPLRMGDWIGRLVSRLALGDLSKIGFGRPAEGPASMVARGRIPLIDVGTIDLIRRGKIEVLPDIASFTEEGVAFGNNMNERSFKLIRPFDAVVLATGYKPKLEDFLEGAGPLMDERGYPRSLDAGDGLYFLGFANPPTGFLRQIAIDAQRIAGWIDSARKRMISPCSTPERSSSPASC